MVQPGDTNSRSERVTIGTFPEILNGADYLMSRNDRRFARRQFTFDDVQIRPAHAASSYTDQDFASTRLRHGHIRELEWICFDSRGRAEQAGFHLATSIGFRDALHFSLVLSDREVKCCTLDLQGGRSINAIDKHCLPASSNISGPSKRSKRSRMAGASRFMRPALLLRSRYQTALR